MTPDGRWLAAVWPFVSAQLPPAPARVLEIGCGPLGGFVPALLGGGYDAVGVDPEAPNGPGYHRVEFEQYQPPAPVEGVVASTSLHHVADLDEVLDRVATALAPEGALVVVEWAWERFDEATARWCFARLAPPAPTAEPGWLNEYQQRWAASGQPWDAYCRAWAAAGGAARRPGDPGRAGRAVRPAAVHRRAVLLPRPCRHHRGRRAGRHRRRPGPGDWHPLRRQAALSRRFAPVVGLELVAYQNVRGQATLVELGDGTGTVTFRLLR